MDRLGVRKLNSGLEGLEGPEALGPEVAFSPRTSPIPLWASHVYVEVDSVLIGVINTKNKYPLPCGAFFLTEFSSIWNSLTYGALFRFALQVHSVECQMLTKCPICQPYLAGACHNRIKLVADCGSFYTTANTKLITLLHNAWSLFWQSRKINHPLISHMKIIPSFCSVQLT